MHCVVRLRSQKLPEPGWEREAERKEVDLSAQATNLLVEFTRQTRQAAKLKPVLALVQVSHQLQHARLGPAAIHPAKYVQNLQHAEVM
jgi:hypothetical protein